MIKLVITILLFLIVIRTVMLQIDQPPWIAQLFQAALNPTANQRPCEFCGGYLSDNDDNASNNDNDDDDDDDNDEF